MLTDDHITMLDLLESKSYPQPTVDQLAAWTIIGSVKRARELLTDLRSLGLCVEVADGHNAITEEGRMARDGTLFA